MIYLTTETSVGRPNPSYAPDSGLPKNLTYQGLENGDSAQLTPCVRLPLTFYMFRA